MKYIVRQRLVAYGYVIVEAECKNAAMKHIPTHGDEIITDGNYFENLSAEPIDGDEYIHTIRDCLIKVKPKNLYYSIRKLQRKYGWEPYFQKIDTTKEKIAHLPNGFDCRGRYIGDSK